MAIPLSGSPPPVDKSKLHDFLTGDNSNFDASIGAWASVVGATLTRDTTFAATKDQRGSLYGGSLKITTTGSGQGAKVTVKGPFRKGVRYTAYALVNSPDATVIEADLSLGDLDGGSGDNVSLGSDFPYQGTNAFQHIGLMQVVWMPTADRATAQMMIRNTDSAARILRLCLALVRPGPPEFIPARQIGLMLTSPSFRLGTRYFGGPQLDITDGATSVGFGLTAGVVGLSGGGAPDGTNGGTGLWAEHTPGSRTGNGINLEAGEDYLGFNISQKASDEIELYPDWGDYFLTFQDGHLAGDTKGWRAADEAGNPTGLLSKSPWRALATAPATPAEGDVYWDTATKRLRVWTGAAWADRVAGAFIRVAASDSSNEAMAAAQFICDGTADDVQVQAAIDALPSTGGVVIVAPGTYAFATTVTITANARILVSMWGAVINLATGVGAVKVNQGVSNARGVRVEGLHVDGGSNATTVGIELEDTNNAEIISPQIENCATGILLDSQSAGKFVEGTLIENPLLRDNTVGVDFSTTSGTGSFAQTVIRGLRCVVGTAGIGLRLSNPGILQRSRIEGTFWLDSSETAVSLDGNIEDSRFRIAIEGAGGATGNVGLLIGTNTTNSDQAFFELLFTGTVATQVNANSKNLHYWSGGSQIVASAGTAVLGYKRHGDATDRLRISGPTAGGKLEFGNGTLLDTNLYRSAASILSSDDKLDPASLNFQTKAGTPVDGDVVGGAADGDAIVDTTASKLWVRIGGAWKSTTLT